MPGPQPDVMTATRSPFLSNLLGERPHVGADGGWLGQLRSRALERANALSGPTPRAAAKEASTSASSTSSCSRTRTSCPLAARRATGTRNGEHET